MESRLGRRNVVEVRRPKPYSPGLAAQVVQKPAAPAARALRRGHCLAGDCDIEEKC